jgi:hypothetical protein
MVAIASGHGSSVSNEPFDHSIVCPACRNANKKKDCRMRRFSGIVHCHHTEPSDDVPGYWSPGKDAKGFTMWKPETGTVGELVARKRLDRALKSPNKTNTSGGTQQRFESVTARKRCMTQQEAERFEKQTGIPYQAAILFGVEVVEKLFHSDVNRELDSWVLPMRSGETGRILGFSARWFAEHYRDIATGGISRIGKRTFGKSGLYYYTDLMPGKPIFVVEGGSDVMAALVLGLNAIGRPSALAGSEDIVALLRARPAFLDTPIYIVGENDRKENGLWPGRDGAEAVARKVSNTLGIQIGVTFPPQGSKDFRDILKTHQSELVGRGPKPLRDLGDALKQHLIQTAVFTGTNATIDAPPMPETGALTAPRNCATTTNSEPRNHATDCNGNKIDLRILAAIKDAGIPSPEKWKKLSAGPNQLWHCGKTFTLRKKYEETLYRFLRCRCRCWTGCQRCRAMNQFFKASHLGPFVLDLSAVFIWRGPGDHYRAVLQQLKDSEKTRLLAVARLKAKTVFGVDECHPNFNRIAKLVRGAIMWRMPKRIELAIQDVRKTAKTFDRENKVIAAVRKKNDIKNEIINKLAILLQCATAEARAKFEEINRIKVMGNYARIQQPGNTQFIITDRKFRGSRKISCKEEAVRELSQAIAGIPTHFFGKKHAGQPIRTSAAWQENHDTKTGQWKRENEFDLEVGLVDALYDERSVEIIGKELTSARLPAREVQLNHSGQRKVSQAVETRAKPADIRTVLQAIIAHAGYDSGGANDFKLWTSETELNEMLRSQNSSSSIRTNSGTDDEIDAEKWVRGARAGPGL